MDTRDPCVVSLGQAKVTRENLIKHLWKSLTSEPSVSETGYVLFQCSQLFEVMSEVMKLKDMLNTL